MTEQDIKAQIFSYLQPRRLMSLSTIASKNGPDICTVFYAVDKDLNLYFVSEPESNHVKNIIKNQTVGCAITDSNQSVSDKKIGVQLSGLAEKITGVEAASYAIDLWNAANPGISSIINLGSITRKVIDSEVFRIRPTKIKFFNEKLFGEEGAEIIEIN